MLKKREGGKPVSFDRSRSPPNGGAAFFYSGCIMHTHLSRNSQKMKISGST